MTAAKSPRRRGTGHELREVALTAAAAQLEHLGDIEALTMREVASGAGVTAPSVYRHFPDKQSLVREVVTRLCTRFTQNLRRAAWPYDLPVEALRAMAHAYVRYGLDNPGHYRVLFSTVHAGPTELGITPGTAHPGSSGFEELIDLVSACLPVNERTGAPVLGTQLWASLHGIVDLRITKPQMPWPSAFELVDLALLPIQRCADSVRPPHGREPR